MDIIEPQLGQKPETQSLQDNYETEKPLPMQTKKKKIAIPILVGVVVLTILAVLTIKPSRNSDPVTGTMESNSDYYEESSAFGRLIDDESDTYYEEYEEPMMLRTKKLSLKEAQEIEPELSPLFGVISTDNVTFSHIENYKGVDIKWTDNQPLSQEKLDWIKRTLDSVPEYYTKNYPIKQLVSASYKELGFSEQEEILYANSAAYASGTNMFISEGLLEDLRNTYREPITEKDFRKTIYHEWMHVAQYYEIIESLTEEYIQENYATGLYLFNVGPYVENFGFAVGWFYEEGMVTPSLKEDSESQKTSWYGQSTMYEDMAETASAFFTCDTAEYSQERINYMSKLTGKSPSYFCN